MVLRRKTTCFFLTGLQQAAEWLQLWKSLRIRAVYFSRRIHTAHLAPEEPCNMMSFWEKIKARLGTIPFTRFSQNSSSNWFCCLLIYAHWRRRSLWASSLGFGRSGSSREWAQIYDMWGFELWTTPHYCYEQCFHFTQNFNMEPKKTGLGRSILPSGKLT